MGQTILEVKRESFYVNGEIINKGCISEGKFIGVYINFFLLQNDNIAGFFTNERNIAELKQNILLYKDYGINLICLNLQGMNPFSSYYKTGKDDVEYLQSSAFLSDGSLSEEYLSIFEDIICFCDNNNICVLINTFNQYNEKIFTDEYSLISAYLNILQWLEQKKFTNILLTINDDGKYPFKNKLFTTNKLIELVKTSKKIYNFIISATVKNNSDYKNNLLEYGDFIPLYINKIYNYNTLKLLEEVLTYKTLPDYKRNPKPIIIIKGDNLNPEYSIYGEYNLYTALQNGVSWCYYEIGTNNYADGFICLPINYSPQSSESKRFFFETVKNINKKEDI